MKTLTIGKNNISVKELEIEQSKLRFYPDNPRVYSVLQVSDETKPEQTKIQELMCSMDHVKQLKESIKSNGGLIDPVIVRDGDFVVLEGNSRLAAYRLLANTDPITWGCIKCILLPADIDDSLIFQLLGQYHIIGRKDWSPYEQAGYLYRRKLESKVPVEQMAADLGMTKGVAQKYIGVYQFMIDNNDLKPDRWSYYEEMLKNRGVKKLINESEETQKVIVSKVKSGELRQASDIRKIGEIANCAGRDKTAKRAMRNFLDGKVSLDEAYVQVQDTGRTDSLYKKAESFRHILFDECTLEVIRENDKLQYELSKIFSKLKVLLNKK